MSAASGSGAESPLTAGEDTNDPLILYCHPSAMAGQILPMMIQSDPIYTCRFTPGPGIGIRNGVATSVHPLYFYTGLE